MDISGFSFGNLTAHFPNLKSIALLDEGFYGSITSKTFEGIENITTLHIIDTNIESIEEDSFRKLKNIHGNTLSLFIYIGIILTHLMTIKGLNEIVNNFVLFFIFRNIIKTQRSIKKVAVWSF